VPQYVDDALKGLARAPKWIASNEELDAMLRKLIKPSLALLLLTGLGACGYSPGHRALTGGVIGAGGGAILGSATGLGAGTGALIGAGVGAGTGAATAR
jgi:osmotically inducible lipoprotein OsmB